MAQNTSIATAATDVRVNPGPGAISNFSKVFSPTTISATVTNADTVLLATLPANSKIIGAAIRVIGASGITGIIALQSTEPTGNVIFLSPTTLAPSVALVAIMATPHVGITTGALSVTGTRALEIVVASGTLSVTNGVIIAVDCQFIAWP